MNAEPTRICVIGAGAIGGWIAAGLANAGHEVMALTSRGPLDQIEVADASSTATVELSRFEGPADVLVIAVKEPALPSVAPTLDALIESETIVLPMLNGVPWWFVEGEPLRSIDRDGG